MIIFLYDCDHICFYQKLILLILINLNCNSSVGDQCCAIFEARLSSLEKENLQLRQEVLQHNKFNEALLSGNTAFVCFKRRSMLYFKYLYFFSFTELLCQRFIKDSSQ